MFSFQRRLKLLTVLVFFASVATLSGCSSARLKERKGERERVAQSSGMYCEFISAEDHQDFEVELNLQMARKCDSDKAFTVSDFRTPSDNVGMVYCCALRNREDKTDKMTFAPKAEAAPKVEAPAKAEAPKADAKTPAESNP
ncbi:MAG: hypothetical protein AB7O96_11295 [Pseudobdellovibrionaceae bacterium]